jgi:hypothetical protein
VGVGSINESERRWWSQKIRVTYPIDTRYYASALRGHILPALDFDRLQIEAEKYGEDYRNSLTRETYGDEGLEQAQFYFEKMVGVRQSLVNLFAVGLSHLFEQQLYHFVSGVPLRNVAGTKNNTNGGPSQCSANFNEDKEACISAGLPITNSEVWPCIEEMRLVCNVIKHAEGFSSRNLLKIRRDLFFYPELPEDSIARTFGTPRVYQPMTGDDIYVEPEDIDVWARAIDRFWEELSQLLLK